MVKRNGTSLQLEANDYSVSVPGGTYNARSLNERERTSGAVLDDRTEVLLEKYGWAIVIKSVPTDCKVVFKAFVTNFSDDYNSSWEEKNVYGRMDPIPTFNRVGRKINIAWQVPSLNIEEGMENLAKCQDLVSMLYPVYTTTKQNESSYISGAPLLRLYFTQMAQGLTKSKYTLLGYVNGAMSVRPEYKEGVFYDGQTYGSGHAVPILINLAINFTVLHDFKLGWEMNKNTNKYLERELEYERYGLLSTSKINSYEERPVKSKSSDLKKDEIKNELIDEVINNRVFGRTKLGK